MLYTVASNRDFLFLAKLEPVIEMASRVKAIRPRLPRGVIGGLKSEYVSWTCMIRRCVSNKYRQFYLYGGRGIKVCDRWFSGDGSKSGFECFIADMGPKPSPDHTIDRQKSSGNYEPGNCRWATNAVQQINRRGVRRGGIATYRGVSYRKGSRSNHWQADFKHNGLRKYLGSFATAEDAARAYDAAATEILGSSATLNFPNKQL